MPDELLMLRHCDVAPSPGNLRGDVGDIAELAQSIDGGGLIQPLVARRTDAGLVLVAGARRHAAIGLLIDAGRAKKTAKWPVVVRDLDEAAAAAAMLVENLHRQDLEPVEEMRGLLRLQSEHGWTLDRIEQATGIPKATVRRRLAWAVLPDHVLDAIPARVGIGYADELAALPAELRKTLLDGGKIPAYHMVDEAKRQRERHAQLRKLTKVLVDHGHLVVDPDSGDQLGEQVAAVLQALEGEVAEINARGGQGLVQKLRYPTVPDSLVERIAGLAPGQLFEVSLGSWNTIVELYAAVDLSADPDPEDDEDEDDGPAPSQSDWQRDRDAAWQADEKARRDHREQRAAAVRAFVREAKAADLTAWTLSQIVRGEEDDDSGRWYVSSDVLRLLGRDSDTDDLFREWSHANATNLARAAAATFIESWGFDPDTLPATYRVAAPELVPQPDRSHYDDEGNHIGPPDAEDDSDTAADLELDPDVDEPTDSDTGDTA